MAIKFLAIDLAKNVFQLHGVDAAGHVVLKRRVARGQLMEVILRLNPCIIGLEACPNAHHWGREFTKLGHEVKLIGPQFVKPFVKATKMTAMMLRGSAKPCNDPPCGLCR